MSTNFPGSLDTFTKPQPTDPRDGSGPVPHAQLHDNEIDSILALETKVGADGSTVVSTLDYLIHHLPWTNLTGTPSTLGGYGIADPVGVADGGSGKSSLTAYSILCGGTTSTGSFQQVSGQGSSGQVLTSNGPNALPTWQSATSGSVTSVGLALPGIFTVTGSPVTISGTLTGSFITQSANQVFAGPSSGAAATPAFRTLVAADIPNISWSTITGTPTTLAGYGITSPLNVAQGGTGAATLTAHAVLLGEGTNAVAFATIGTGGRLLIDQGATADPAFTAVSGDAMITNAGVLTVTKVDGVTYPASPTTNTVPVVTSANTVTYEAVPNAALANSSVTVTAGAGLTGGGAVSLGSSVTVGLSVPVSVTNGGTGNATLTAHAVLLGEGTGTIAFATIGTAGRLLLDQGAGVDPSFNAMSGDATITSAGATTVAKVNAVAYPASPSTNTVPVVTGANTVTYEAVPNAALANSSVTVTAGTGLSGGGSVALGSSITLSLATPVTTANGGTGLTTLTAHAVLLGEGTGNVAFAATGTAGQLLIDQGSGSDPAFTAMSGDASITAGGVVTVAKVDGVAYPANPATNTIPVVTGANTVTYQSNDFAQTDSQPQQNEVVLANCTSLVYSDPLLIASGNYVELDAGALLTLEPDEHVCRELFPDVSQQTNNTTIPANAKTVLFSDPLAIAAGTLCLIEASGCLELAPYAEYAADGLTVQQSGNVFSATVPRGWIDGLTLAYVSTTSFSVAAGQAADSTTALLINLSASMTKTTSAWSPGNNGGGLDAGTIAASTWYHVFLIYSTSLGADVLFSTSVATPALPAGFAYKRRIGSVLTNGSSQWTQWAQVGDEFLWSAVVKDVDGATCTSTSSTTALTVPSGVQVQAILNATISNATTNTVLYLSCPDQNDEAANGATGTPIRGLFRTETLGSVILGGWVRIRTDTSRHIRFISTNASGDTFSIGTMGWQDPRGKNN